MIHQYYILLSSWEDEGCPSTVESAAGSLKKHPSFRPNGIVKKRYFELFEPTYA
jgi:hypothetical protein